MAEYNLSGKKVRQLRDKYEISQEYLACETNMEQKLIYKIESDKCKRVTLCVAYKIAKYFNVSIESLIE